MNDRTKIHKREPLRYFRLEIQHPREQVPDDVLAMLGKVMKGAEWERLGFIPYNIDEFDPIGVWQATSFGRHVANDTTYTFVPFIDQKWSEAIRTGKRHVNTEFDVLALRKLGVPYGEMAKVPAHYRSYSEARLAQDRDDLIQAIEHARDAVQRHPHSERYNTLLLDLRVFAGDVSVINEGLHYYSADMDSAVHAGCVERWLKLAFTVENGYRIALDICVTVLRGLDSLVAGRSDGRRIYGPQATNWYYDTRTRFVKRLGSMRGFICPELARQNLGRVDDLERVLSLIAGENPSKVRSIEKLRAVLRC